MVSWGQKLKLVVRKKNEKGEKKGGKLHEKGEKALKMHLFGL